MSLPLFLAAADAMLPILILAAVAACDNHAFIYLPRHLQKMERMIAQDDLVPAALGAQDDVALIVCAIPIVGVSLAGVPDNQGVITAKEYVALETARGASRLRTPS